MSIFDVLTLLGGIALFLFGMTYMGDSLKKLAGNQMKVILTKVTSNPFTGFLLGMGVTMIIQSSTATNVMVLSFVNIGMLTLKNAIPLVIGANLGTTITAWIISLSSIDGVSLVFQLLKPSSFTPVVIFIGVILYRFTHKAKKQDVGAILIGFALLMYGMTTMSGSMTGLSEVPQFTSIIKAMSNPFLGMITGIVLAAVMQSSSASVGILQALALAGDINFEAVIPLVLGINIGQVVPVLIASSGTSRDAKRMANVNLMLNVLGAVVVLPVYIILRSIGALPFLSDLAAPVTIAITHSGYKLISTIWQLPARKFFENMSAAFIREKKEVKASLLDSRLLATPSLALAQCRQKLGELIKASNDSFATAISLLDDWNDDKASSVHDTESMADLYQDEIDEYLAKLSSRSLTEKESSELSHLMHVASDSENITDHIYHITVSLGRMTENGKEFPAEALADIKSLAGMLSELLELSEECFYTDDKTTALNIVKKERNLIFECERFRDAQIDKVTAVSTSAHFGSYYTDIILDFERIADHLSKGARTVVI